MDFDRLCQASPALAELKRQAREAAQESLLDWYPDRVRRARDIRDESGAVAMAVGLSFPEVYKIVCAGLIDVYEVARARHRRKAKAGRQGA